MFEGIKKTIRSWLLTDPALIEVFGGSRSAAGMLVNERTALGIATVYACVRLISENIATLPCLVTRNSGAGAEPALRHPLYPLLHDAPNSQQTAAQFIQYLVACLLLRGNAYLYPIRSTKDG